MSEYLFENSVLIAAKNLKKIVEDPKANQEWSIKHVVSKALNFLSKVKSWDLNSEHSIYGALSYYWKLCIPMVKSWVVQWWFDHLVTKPFEDPIGVWLMHHSVFKLFPTVWIYLTILLLRSPWIFNGMNIMVAKFAISI